MGINKTNSRKMNGVFYTPTVLAQHLVEPIINSSKSTVFDPAYGNGILLVAAGDLLNKRFNIMEPYSRLHGCDRQPGDISQIPIGNENLVKEDFFKFSTTNKYNTIVMNPPYVRHHFIGDEERAFYNQRIPESCNIKGTSDLWTFFLAKATDHLKTGGNLGAILPWSFLQADYARQIRGWLFNKFEVIKVFAVGTKYFNGTDERVLLLWLKNFKQQTQSIKIAFAKDINEKPVYSNLNENTWASSRVMVIDNCNVEDAIQNYVKKYQFRRFGDIADVRIGVVTGADKFFIIPEKEAGSMNFLKNQFLPIISSAKEFDSLQLNGNPPKKRLLLFSQIQNSNERSYIKKGELNGYHLRAHSRLRTPWYNVKIGQLPDAFFPYRMAHTPYLMLNSHFQCTNSIHRIYFKGLTSNEKKWAQVSLLSAYGQLSLERYSKTYGRGVLKVEPTALKKSIIYLSKDPSINSIYNTLSTLIAGGKKSEAMMTATIFLGKMLGITKDESEKTIEALTELRQKRFLSSPTL